MRHSASGRAFVQAALILCWCGTLGAAQIARIRVTNADTDDPIAGAVVSALGERVQWHSDDSDRVILHLQHAGATVFTVRRLGFGPIVTTLEVPERDTLKVHVVMQPTHVAMLDTVNVTASAGPDPLAEFEHRRSLNQGTFITRVEIERRNPQVATDLLRNVIGLRVLPTGAIVSTRGLGALPDTGRTPSDPVPSKGAPKGFQQPIAATSDLCPVPIVLDGVPVGTGDDARVDDISPGEIYAIEIYRGAATIPVRYLSMRNGSCGLILIWTRSGFARAGRGG